MIVNVQEYVYVKDINIFIEHFSKINIQIKNLI